MVKMLEIREMMRLVDRSSLEKLEVKNGNFRVLIKKGRTTPELHIDEISTPLVHPADNQSNDQSETDVTSQPHVLKSKNVGTFQSLAKPGGKVQIGTLLGHCTVTALNVKFEITSDSNGIVSEVLVKEGQLIDYGQPLYKITVGKEHEHV